MYEERLITESKFEKIREFFTPNNSSWIVFGIIILAGIIARIFLWNFTSTDIFVWKDAAQLFLNGENPYQTTLESFQIEEMKHFYAYFPLWMYFSSLILLIFPETWFFGVTKGFLILFDLQVIILLYMILQKKVSNVWRLKMPIAVWFITPMVLMTGAMHGKFDSLMFVFILLACIFNEKKGYFLEGIFLSLAILTKPIALILVPFFLKNDIRERNFSSLFTKIAVLFVTITLFSLPFLSDPLLYIQGVLGVHVTRDHDLGLLFALLSLPFSSASADSIIRICLTIVIVAVWIFLIIISYIKDYDIYKSIFLAFVGFNSLYWVFLIQYAVWIYTFYIIHTSKTEKMKNWQLATSTGVIIVISTVGLALLGTFVKHGL
ncbi:MAG: glycosyltransferase 87 family protein [Candidatus Heimdallarchaeota archaeon]